VVIGRLLPGDPNNPGPEALSVKATKLRVIHPAINHSAAAAASAAWGRHLERLKHHVYHLS